MERCRNTYDDDANDADGADDVVSQGCDFPGGLTDIQIHLEV